LHVCATNFSLNCMKFFHGYTVQYFMRMQCNKLSCMYIA